MMPDETNSRWIRRYVELRRPYLHIYSVPEGDEINAINLTHARVDHDPQLAHLLRGNGGGNGGASTVFAVFAPQNTFLFRGRGERDRVEWILKIDESYFGSGGTSSGSSGSSSGREEEESEY